MNDDFLTRPKWLGVKHELRLVGNIYMSGWLFKIASHSNKTVCISSCDNLLFFKPFINKSFTPFTSLSKNSTYHGARGKFKCYSINLLATKFLLSPETKIDPLYDMTLFRQQQYEENCLKFWVKDGEFMLGTKSKEMTVLAAHVYSVTHALCIMSFSTK